MITIEQATALINANERRYDIEHNGNNQPSAQREAAVAQLKQVASHVFSEMTVMRPGWKVGFSYNGQLDAKQVTAYKIQLLKAMRENGIDTMDKVESGLKCLRAQPGQFLPSIGDFVQACTPPKSGGEMNVGMYRIWERDRRIDSMTAADRRAIAEKEMAKIRRNLQKGSA